MELKPLESDLWYDSDSCIVYFENKRGDLINMGEYDMYSDSENPFSTPYFYDNQYGGLGICYFDVDYANDECTVRDLSDVESPLIEFEMKYVSDYYSVFEEEEGVFEFAEDTWVYEIDNDTQLPIFFNLDEIVNRKREGRNYITENQKVAPQFDKKEDELYLALLNKSRAKEYLDLYIQKMKC